MKIESSVSETPVGSADTPIIFPQGIPGFEDDRAFRLYHQQADALVGYLESVDNPDLVLSVLAPESLNIFYEFTLSDEEQALLELERPEDVVLLVVAYRQETGDTKPGGAVNASFMAPLVINAERRLGLQKLLYNAERRITIKAS